MKPILVLDAETDQALAIVRGMDEKGIPVHVAGSKKTGPALWSLLAKKRLLCPSAVRFPKAFIAWMAARLQAENYEAVFPVSDSTISILQKFRSELPPVPFMMAGQEAYRKVSDKFFSHELARRAGLQVPETFYPQSQKELKEIIPRFSFPLVVKPRFSRFYNEAEEKLQIGDGRIVNDEEELENFLSDLKQGASFPAIQRWVEGKGFGVELLVKGGEALAIFCHERLREMDPLGAGSSVCQSAPLREDLVKASLAMLKAANYEGVAMVEFRVDERRNQTWFMEINGRFWGSLALPLACGVNFPYLYFQTFVRGETPAAKKDYPFGVRARSLWKDTVRLRRIMKGQPSSWKGFYPSRREGLGEYFGSFFEPNQIYCDFQWKDPLPALTASLAVIFQ